MFQPSNSPMTSRRYLSAQQDEGGAGRGVGLRVVRLRALCGGGLGRSGRRRRPGGILLEEAGHEWLRPLARSAAVLVPAARGEWITADEHARAAASQPGRSEPMVVAATPIKARTAPRHHPHSDHDAVLRALEPMLLIRPATATTNRVRALARPLRRRPGQCGQADEAEELLRPHEDLAAARHRGSTIARLAQRTRQAGRLRSHLAAADTVFKEAGTWPRSRGRASSEPL